MMKRLVELVMLERDVIADYDDQRQLLEVLVHHALQLRAHLHVLYTLHILMQSVDTHLWQRPLVAEKRFAEIENVDVRMRHHLDCVVFDSCHCVVHCRIAADVIC